MANVVVLEDALIDECAASLSTAHNELYWMLQRLEFGAGAVPWQRDTQNDWGDIRSRMKNELGYMEADVRYLRQLAEWTRVEQLKLALPILAGLLTAFAGPEPVAPPIPVDKDKPVAPVNPPINNGTPSTPPVAPLKPIADLPRAEQLAEFKKRYLGKIGVQEMDGVSNPETDGQCPSLVKRYARELDPSLGALTADPPSNGPAFPGWSMIPLTAGVKVQAGDIVYFNYDYDDDKATPPVHNHYHHMAVATSPEDEHGNFEMIESHGFEPNGKGLVDPASKATVQLSHQGHTYLTAIMRRN
jgi:hypothetical protein